MEQSPPRRIDMYADPKPFMNPDWLAQAYAYGPEEELARGSLQPFFRWFNDLLRQHGRFAMVIMSAIMRDLDLPRLAPVFMIAIIRMTSNYQIHLNQRQQLILRVRDELLRRGWDREHVYKTMQFLIDKNLNLEIPYGMYGWPSRGPSGTVPDSRTG